MKLSEFTEKSGFEVITLSSDTEKEVTKPFCCDLLSWAMGRAPEGCAWATVMANLNTLAVAELADAACVILCEGARPDENMIKKAAAQDITLLASSLPVFEAALAAYNVLS